VAAMGACLVPRCPCDCRARPIPRDPCGDKGACPGLRSRVASKGACPSSRDPCGRKRGCLGPRGPCCCKGGVSGSRCPCGHKIASEFEESVWLQKKRVQVRGVPLATKGRVRGRGVRVVSRGACRVQGVRVALRGHVRIQVVRVVAMGLVLVRGVCVAVRRRVRIQVVRVAVRKACSSLSGYKGGVSRSEKAGWSQEGLSVSKGAVWPQRMCVGPRDLCGRDEAVQVRGIRVAARRRVRVRAVRVPTRVVCLVPRVLCGCQESVSGSGVRGDAKGACPSRGVCVATRSLSSLEGFVWPPGWHVRFRTVRVAAGCVSDSEGSV